METLQYIRSLNKGIPNRAGRLFFFFLSRFGKLRVGGEAKREESKKTFQLGLPARAIPIPFSFFLPLFLSPSDGFGRDTPSGLRERADR